MKTPVKAIAVDLRRLEYIGSMGLRVIFKTIINRVEKHGN